LRQRKTFGNFLLMMLMTHCQLLKTQSVGAGWANEYRAPAEWCGEGIVKVLEEKAASEPFGTKRSD